MKKLIAAALLAALSGGAALAQQADALVPPMQYLGLSQPVRELALLQQDMNLLGLMPPTEMIQKHGPLITETEVAGASAQAAQVDVVAALVQTTVGKPLAAVAGANFEGPGVGLGGFVMSGAPPDTTLAVGPNHVIAWVNSMYAVMTKTGTVLSLVNGNTPFAGVGNLCASTNRGDPILQYDRRADRWILSQFAFDVVAGNPAAPFLQCIAISQTPDPLGAYHRYSVNYSAVGFNDYGKLGIFDDGYYTSYNMFALPNLTFTGVALCASDRTKMLAGDPTATTLCAPVASYGGGGSFLPADVDGATAPTNTAQGNIFMRYSFGGVSLRLLKLKPNFAAGTVTLTDGLGGAPGSFVNIPVGPTTVACNGSSGACVAQPGTANRLDTLADRLMYRLAYRNRGGVDSLMVSHAVDPDGAGARSSAERWYEVRSPFAAVPTLFQNATYDPGALGDRWMGSVAMDKMGNMMMGYSMAHAAAGVKPSIRITGRLRSDVRNQMQGEHVIVTGTGSQTGTLTRWGDYTTMQVDPANDCTFWYIGQYLAADGTFNWRTRVASYKFNNCI